MLNVPETPKFNVEQMAKILNMRKNTGGPATILFLGSRTSSLFRRPFLVDQLKGFSYRDFSNMTLVEQFRECYKILEDFKKEKLDRDIHFIIRQALQEQHIEVADICVAELMKHGIFDSIITTNIGSELELAFRQSGMEEPRNFEIVIPGSGKSLAGKMTKGPPFKMLKASGDLISKRYSICGYNIDSQELFLDTYPELKTSLRQTKEEALLMVGFDAKWDEYILHAIFPHERGSLWYTNEEQIAEDSLFSSYLDIYKAQRIEDTSGGYETFFVNLCWHVLGFIPSIPIDQMTLDKLTSNDKTFDTRRIQQNLLHEMNSLTESLNQLLESQETMKKDIKSLGEKIDTLFTNSTSNTGSLPSTSADTISTSQEKKERPTRKAKQLEEN